MTSPRTHVTCLVAVLIFWPISPLLGKTQVTPRYDWSNYDPDRQLRLTGSVVAVERLDGVVVIRIRTNETQRSLVWVVALGTPEELRRAGLVLELPLGASVDALVWERRMPGNREARAQRVAFNGGSMIDLK